MINIVIWVVDPIMANSEATNSFLYCRHPDSSLRPGFRDLLLALLQNVEVVLAIPEDARATHAQASVLGAPLEAGEQMYHDLQQTYLEQ